MYLPLTNILFGLCLGFVVLFCCFLHTLQTTSNPSIFDLSLYQSSTGLFVLHKVQKPESFGVAKINKNNKILAIKEKPKKFFSDLAITGLYFFDNKVVNYSKTLKPSKRGEVEIADLLNIYRSKNQLSAHIIGRGGAWLDTGSIEDFYKTSAFVSAVENRQGFKISCIEEIAFNNKWITKKNILESIKFYGKCDYSNYLLKLIK